MLLEYASERNCAYGLNASFVTGTIVMSCKTLNDHASVDDEAEADLEVRDARRVTR
jgi:hypothetical protein